MGTSLSIERNSMRPVECVLEGCFMRTRNSASGLRRAELRLVSLGAVSDQQLFRRRASATPHAAFCNRPPRRALPRGAGRARGRVLHARGVERRAPAAALMINLNQLLFNEIEPTALSSDVVKASRGIKYDLRHDLVVEISLVLVHDDGLGIADRRDEENMTTVWAEGRNHERGGVSRSWIFLSLASETQATVFCR